MALNWLVCGHTEDPSTVKEFRTMGNPTTVYTHRECVKGHVIHPSPPGVTGPAPPAGRVRVERIEEFCPVCLIGFRANYCRTRPSRALPATWTP
jgi:hypothetical protein